MHIPTEREQWPAVFWKDLILMTNKRIQSHRHTIETERMHVERENIKRCTERAQADFDSHRRPRMYKTVLMRNTPFIPLWGVVLKHPTEVDCTRPMAEVCDFLPADI